MNEDYLELLTDLETIIDWTRRWKAVRTSQWSRVPERVGLPRVHLQVPPLTDVDKLLGCPLAPEMNIYAQWELRPCAERVVWYYKS